MAQPNDQFNDERLRAALKRSSAGSGASPQLRARIASILEEATPGAADSFRLPQPARTRVFGLPRAWAVAAGLALMLVSGSMILYQTRDWWPANSPTLTAAELKQQMLVELAKVHDKSSKPSAEIADLQAFRQSLSTSMPVATISGANVQFVSARLDQFNRHACYALTYLIDGKSFTLVTAVLPAYTKRTKYADIEAGVRLVGGEKGGYLVCLIGEPDIPADRYQSFLDAAEFLPSPSTQPASAVASNCPSKR